MGNSLGAKRSAKVMKINEETFKLKTPIQAGSVLEHHPGHVLLESEAVKHYGLLAKPLEPQQELQPKRLYFLVEMPKFPEKNGTRRVRSSIQMGAQERLESLMLARRSASALADVKPISILVEEEKKVVSVKIRLPKAEFERLVAESKDRAEAAEKILSRCMHGGAAAEQNGARNYEAGRILANQ